MSISDAFDANAVVYGSQLNNWEKHNVISIIEWAIDAGDPRRACAKCDRWDGVFPGTTHRTARRVTYENSRRPPGQMSRSVEEALTVGQTRWVAAMVELWQESPWRLHRYAPTDKAAEKAGISKSRSFAYYHNLKYRAIRQEFEATRDDDVRQGCHGCYASFFDQQFAPKEREARFQELVQGRRDWKATVQALLDHDERAVRDEDGKLTGVTKDDKVLTAGPSLKLWTRERGQLEKRLKNLREVLLELNHDPLKVAASGGLYA